jgi:hypothetical protein
MDAFLSLTAPEHKLLQSMQRTNLIAVVRSSPYCMARLSGNLQCSTSLADMANTAGLNVRNDLPKAKSSAEYE